MSVFKRIIHAIDGKEYYRLSKQEKKEIRETEYRQILSSYIIIASIFFVFVLCLFILGLTDVLYIPLLGTTFNSMIAVLIFLAVVTILMFVQKIKDFKVMSKVKFDLLINVVILIFLSFISINDIQNTGQIALYAVGIMTFAFLVKMRPLATVPILSTLMIGMILYVNYRHLSSVSVAGFVINIVALNLIAIFISRWLFVDNIYRYNQNKIITEQNKVLDSLTKKDYMTEIYNRRGFALRIGEPIKRPAAVCLVDLDGLKLLNDAMGHTKGDCAIILATEILQEVFEGSFCARIGGDEFVVIVEDAKEVDVAQKVQQFRDSLESNKTLEINISASVGYAMLREDEDFMSAYKNAENIMYHLKLGARSSRKNRSMEALMAALHDYTGESERHCHRVGYICQQLLPKLGFNRKTEQDAMKLIGQLHDIGKLSIPQNILQKKGTLTEDEWSALKQHSEESYKIVCGLIDDKDIANSILYHHEHWDGSGYPYRLKGEDIPIFARILAVADSYDAMMSERSYQKKKTHEEACKELIRCSGTQFDPKVVDAFLSIDENRLKY